jgi:hypothetical protein
MDFPQFHLLLLQILIDCYPFLGFRFAPPQAEISRPFGSLWLV